MKRGLAASVLAAAMCLISTSTQAALTPGQKMAAEAFIKQFSAPEFDVRQKAVDRLVEMGPDVVPLVRKALAETADNEVKLRCEMVLKALGAAEAEPAQKKVDAGKFGTEASKVTVRVKDGDLDAVLQALADQSGNARIEMPKDWEGKPVSLDVADAPYFAALDKLCADAKLVYVAEPQTGGLRLVPAKDSPAPSACTGPADVRLETATLVKQYSPASGPMNMVGAMPEMLLALSWFYEDRLRPIDVQASVTKVVTDGGKELALGTQAGGVGGMVAVAMRMMGQARGCSGSFSATVAEMPPNVPRLRSIEGVVTLTFGAGEREIKIEDAFGDDGKSVTVGKDAVTVVQFRKRQGAATVTIKHTIDGKDAPARELAAPYGIVLVDPKGNRHAPAAGGGLWNLFRGGFGGPPAMNDVRIQVQGGGPGMVVGGGPGNPGGGTVSARFQGLPEIEGQWTVLYVIPETLTEKEWPFKLTDIPLP